MTVTSTFRLAAAAAPPAWQPRSLPPGLGVAGSGPVGDSKLEMFAIDGLSMCTPSQLAPGPGPPGRHGGTARATATRDRDGPSSPVSEPTAAESDSESSAALSAVSGGSPVSLGPVLETELDCRPGPESPGRRRLGRRPRRRNFAWNTDASATASKPSVPPGQPRDSSASAHGPRRARRSARAGGCRR